MELELVIIERTDIMICLSCNKNFNKLRAGGLCRVCHKYFKAGGTINPLPDVGTIAHDERGYVVCHICGKAYKRLGSHVKGAHNMTIKAYKEAFGLCNNAKTTESNYARMMHDYAYQYNMPEQLRLVGAGTRIKPGETHLRLGKPTRLQENLAKRKRCLG